MRTSPTILRPSDAPLDTTAMFSNGIWHAGPKLPSVALYAFRAVATSKHDVLVISGRDAAQLAVQEVHSYSFVTGRWSRKADILTARYDYAAAMITLTNGDRIVLVVGGYYPEVRLNTVEVRLETGLILLQITLCINGFDCN